MKMMSKVLSVTAAAAMVLIPTEEAAAQVCAGFPAAQGQYSLGLRYAQPVVGNTLGIEGSLNRVGNAAVFGNVNLISPEGEADRQTVVGLGAAYEVGTLVPAIPEFISVCPMASVNMSRYDGNTRFSIPLGIGFGTTIGLPDGPIVILPYAIPQFNLVQVGLDNVSWDHNFGIGFGAMARVGPGIYGGVEFGRAFVEGADFDIAFRGGITFPRQ
jgi:hypothetical protein